MQSPSAPAAFLAMLVRWKASQKLDGNSRNLGFPWISEKIVKSYELSDFFLNAKYSCNENVLDKGR